jgi:hypothetical protein
MQIVYYLISIKKKKILGIQKITFDSIYSIYKVMQNARQKNIEI